MIFAPLTLPALAFILAQATTCPAAPRPVVHVELHAEDPPLDTSMSTQELTRGFMDSVSKNVIKEGLTGIGGLAPSSTQAHFTREFVQEQAGSGICLTVARVDVDIIYTPRIYVGSDIVGRACWYDLTYAHELRHIGTDIELINDLTPRVEGLVQQTLGEAAAKNGGLLTSQQSYDAQVDIDGRLMKVMDTFHTEYTALREQRQAQFDNRQNYDYEMSLCAGK